MALEESSPKTFLLFTREKKALSVKQADIRDITHYSFFITSLDP
jgi:hypothetical protein